MDNTDNNIDNNKDIISPNNKDINMKSQITIKDNSNINNNMKNNNININNDINNMNMNSNMIKSESIGNLNPIKINNEIHLNDVISTNSVNKKLHAFDQKLLNLELYTKEKIIELITQINLLKQNNNINIKVPEKNDIESNKNLIIQNITPSSCEKYKTFNNSFSNNQNQKLTQHNSFNVERMYETNNENNKNILNISNNINQSLLLNNLDKKRYPLRNVNTKQAFLNSKVQKKNSISYNLNSNNIISKKLQNNSLTENNNNNNNNNINGNIIINNSCSNNNNNNNNYLSLSRNNANVVNSVNNMNNINSNILIPNSTKEIIEGTGTKIIHNINNDINAKFLKDTEKKMDSNNVLKVSNIDDLYSKKSNKSINYIPNRNSFGESSFNGAEIKLVDLNKLVNHQLPRNRLIPIYINENEYFDHLKSK